MESLELVEHDLSLTFDGQGRLWRFRSTAGAENARVAANAAETGDITLDAHMTVAGLVVTLGFPGIQPGDVEINLDGNVLQLDGRGSKKGALAYTVALPRRIAIGSVETAYSPGHFEVLLPAKAAARTEPATAAPAAKASEAVKA